MTNAQVQEIKIPHLGTVEIPTLPDGYAWRTDFHEEEPFVQFGDAWNLYITLNNEDLYSDQANTDPYNITTEDIQASANYLISALNGTTDKDYQFPNYEREEDYEEGLL